MCVRGHLAPATPAFLPLTCSWLCTRKAPIFLRPPVSGSPSTFLDRNLMMGMKMPPARAVVLGSAGDTKNSGGRGGVVGWGGGGAAQGEWW